MSTFSGNGQTALVTESLTTETTAVTRGAGHAFMCVIPGEGNNLIEATFVGNPTGRAAFVRPTIANARPLIKAGTCTKN